MGFLPTGRRNTRTALILIIISIFLVFWRFLPAGPDHASHNPEAGSQPPPQVYLGHDKADQPTKKLEDLLFPILAPKKKDSWHNENHRALKSLLQCLSTSKCDPNQTKVVILASYHFRGALWGWNSGEDIWAASTTLALKNLGYTFLYSDGIHHAVQLYQMFPTLVKIVIMQDDEGVVCIKDTEDCLLSDRNPYGIPIYKIFFFHFWPWSPHPLGPAWTLSPEAWRGDADGEALTWLGYSIEASCKSRPFVPHAKRREEAYILSKYTWYFRKSRNTFNIESFAKASKAAGVRFVGGIQDVEGGFGDDDPEKDEVPLYPDGFKNLGGLGPEEFYTALSKTKVLIGIGNPATSPTPYDALCLGIPFVNPIFQWDSSNTTDRAKWHTQHNILKWLDPPYVYNVGQFNEVDFVKAVKGAVDHPIDRYILDGMRMEAVEARLEAIVDRDWKKEAAEWMERPEYDGQGFHI